MINPTNQLIDWWRRRRWAQPAIRKVRAYQSASALPMQLPRRVLAVAGEPATWAVFECPCGTGHRLQIRIRSNGSTAAWDLSSVNGRPTLSPSVDYDSPGRRCHFWLRDGNVIWVHSA